MNERVTLAIGDTYHAVLKLMAAARAATLTEMVERLLCDGLRREFERDPRLALVVRELVTRDEQADPLVRARTLELLNVLIPAEK
jgi:hypothetical protein